MTAWVYGAAHAWNEAPNPPSQSPATTTTLQTTVWRSAACARSPPRAPKALCAQVEGALHARPRCADRPSATPCFGPALQYLRRAKNRTQKGERSCEQWTWLPSLRSRELCAEAIAAVPSSANEPLHTAPEGRHMHGGEPSTLAELALAQRGGQLTVSSVLAPSASFRGIPALLDVGRRKLLRDNGGLHTRSCRHAQLRGRSTFLCSAGMVPRLG